MITIDIFWPLPLATLQASLLLISGVVVYWLVRFIIAIITG